MKFKQWTITLLPFKIEPGVIIVSLADLSFKSGVTYTFIEEIGRGGMGIVYLAEKHCEGVSDLVVLKTIRTMREKQVEGLKREANIAAALRHENVIRTHGLEAIPFEILPAEFQQEISTLKKETSKRSGTKGKEILSNMRLGKSMSLSESGDAGILKNEDHCDGTPLYLMVMDYIEGWDLREIHSKHIRAGLLLPVPLNAFIVSRICRALDYAHQYIIHRDISPENILINQQGVAKLTDFGIAIAADQEVYGLAGKIQYMAPEQVQYDQVDNRSDIFALGLVAYHLLTGISLFLPPRGLSFKEQATYYEELLENEIVPPHEICLDIPQEYSMIVMKMLDIEPESRYRTIEAAGNDIEKKYLYKEGFGPTNNGLAAYLKIFESEFKLCTKQDLQQLTFLAKKDGKYNLKRKISKKLYTEKGRRLLRDRRKLT